MEHRKVAWRTTASNCEVFVSYQDGATEKLPGPGNCVCSTVESVAQNSPAPSEDHDATASNCDYLPLAASLAQIRQSMTYVDLLNHDRPSRLCLQYPTMKKDPSTHLEAVGIPHVAGRHSLPRPPAGMNKVAPNIPGTKKINSVKIG